MYYAVVSDKMHICTGLLYKLALQPRSRVLAYHVLVQYSLEAKGKNSIFYTCYNIETHFSLTYHTPGECGSLVVEYQSNQDTLKS